MKIIRIKNCKECPYFDTDMDDSKEDYGDLLCLCGAISEIPFGARIIENKGKELSKILDEFLIENADLNDENFDKYREEEDKVNDEYFEKLELDIPKWCPLEDYKEGEE